jgi:hypothetical protein
VISAPHAHLGHRLSLSNTQSLDDLNAEVQELYDGPCPLLAIYCWCESCGSAVTLYLEPVGEELVMRAPKVKAAKAGS